MISGLKHIINKLFHVYDYKDISTWDYPPESNRPIYGIYHVFCTHGWQRLVKDQIRHLKESGLANVTCKLYVSVITPSEDEVIELLNLINIPNCEIISFQKDYWQYEYPALTFVKKLAMQKDCFIYYFHTKGVSYQSIEINDRLYQSFMKKIESWRKMMEYFIFSKWKVAVNTLSAGYDTYGCYRWPPKNYTMFSGNFWWTRSEYAKTLPEFDEEVIRKNRFFSETWLFTQGNNVFSPFETVADLYFVNIPKSIYTMKYPPISDRLYFIIVYNWRKFLKHAFNINYKNRCQKRFQQLKKV